MSQKILFFFLSDNVKETEYTFITNTANSSTYFLFALFNYIYKKLTERKMHKEIAWKIYIFSVHILNIKMH